MDRSNDEDLQNPDSFLNMSVSTPQKISVNNKRRNQSDQNLAGNQKRAKSNNEDEYIENDVETDVSV